MKAISPLTECAEAPEPLCHDTAEVGELETFLLGTEYWYSSVLSTLGALILLARLWLNRRLQCPLHFLGECFLFPWYSRWLSRRSEGLLERYCLWGLEGWFKWRSPGLLERGWFKWRSPGLLERYCL